MDRLNEIGICSWKNPNAITVVTSRMYESVINVCNSVSNDDFLHVVCMLNVTKSQIYKLISDIF